MLDYRKVGVHVTLLVLVIAAVVFVRIDRERGSSANDPVATAAASSVTAIGTSTREATKTPKPGKKTPTPSPMPSPTSTPMPTPTPTPPPPPLARCYQPRPAAFSPATPQATPAGTPVVGPTLGTTEDATPETAATPTSTEAATPAGPTMVLSPADPTSLFQNCQMIAYYGFPDVPQMGIVGEYDPDTVVQKLLDQAKAYDDVNGFRGVAPTIQLIYAVAQDHQTPDGTYLSRMSDDMVEQWIGIADKYDLLLVLDIQMGSSTVEAEFPHVEKFLKNPRVHLGLDPEFVVGPGEVPGGQFGSLDVSQINTAQHLLQKLIDENHLPNKVLIVHQFLNEMITNKSQIENVPGVDLVIDQDGFGNPDQKTGNYRKFVKIDGAEHGGFKLFYKQDEPLMTPEQVDALDPQPDFVVYQ
jgi:outer membrane biosynthesis protein TonB